MILKFKMIIYFKTIFKKKKKNTYTYYRTKVVKRKIRKSLNWIFHPKIIPKFMIPQRCLCLLSFVLNWRIAFNYRYSNYSYEDPKVESSL